ncbi:methyltransferase [Beggiatoa alba]|nr:methyltransferase [Beggiatoa alba]
MYTFNTPQGDFSLYRYPKRKKESLRAWDAADEYVLNHLDDALKNKQRILIINDNFGALAVALHAFAPTIQTDSYLAYQGILANLALNNLASDTITLLNSMDKLNGTFDLVIIKVPKSHAYLEDILYKIQKHIHSDTQLLSAAMAKNIHRSTLQLYEEIIGKTKTSLARKKARLIFTSFTNQAINTNKTSPYPKSFKLEETDLTISHYSNVFSKDKLDIGTRFFLQHLPTKPLYQTIIDLGCGNGVLGLIAARHHPDAKLIFTDESYMAIASAKQNYEHAFSNRRDAEFLVSDCLAGIDPVVVKTDLILCNPPFHQNHVVSDHIAWQMFNEAYAVLNQGGEFWVVGNHHMAYHTKLKKIFGGYTVVASNKKFAVMFSRKS